MIDLIQVITVQQAYDEITHERWRASWNCRWRKVDDDDGDDFPSPEPETDSRSALQVKNRMWRRLRIAKRDETFSLIFFPGETEDIELSLGAVVPRGPHKPSRRGLGGGRGLWACGPLARPLRWIFAQVFSFIPEKISVNFQDISRTFISAQKQHHGNSAENSISSG